MSLFTELKRRNVLRAGVLYAGAVWALAQGIAQLTPVVGAPEWSARWFLIAAAIGFPFWIAFAWFYEFTPQGLKRESEIDPADSIAHSTGRKLDFWIIGIMALAIVLLVTNTFVLRRDATSIADKATTRAITARPAKVPQKSVAVLPFANDSGKQDEQFFSDGLSEDLITALSQFDGLKVISRKSAFHFRNSKDDNKIIGEKLGVAHLLEGSVRRQGEEVRISAELVNASDGRILWSQRYDKPYKDLFALQDDITQAVADALKAKLMSAPGIVVQSDRPPSGNLDAYIAYQHGLAFNDLGSEAGLRQAVDAFDQAIRLDPHYAAAYARLSLAWNGLAAQVLSGAQTVVQANARARHAVNTALELDPDSSPAHQALAYLLLNVEMDWTGAKVEAQRALKLAPNDPSAQFDLSIALATEGHVQQAVDLTREALVADPRHDGWYYWLAVYLAGLGRLDEARQAASTAIALQPTADGYHGQLAIVEILQGDDKAALAAAQQESPGLWHATAVALALQFGAGPTAAEGALKQLVDRFADQGPYQIAGVYALRRDPDNMFKWLDHAWTRRDPGIGYLLFDPFILRFQDDPRFAAFCKKVGLPTTTDAVAMP